MMAQTNLSQCASLVNYAKFSERKSICRCGRIQECELNDTYTP